MFPSFVLDARKEISKNITILMKLEAKGMSLEGPPSTMGKVGKGGGKWLSK